VALEHSWCRARQRPQVGLLALQGAAYDKVETYPLDVLGAQTEGMIGYMIEQELGNLLPFERPFATLLTMIEVDGADPAFADPTKFIGPVYAKEEADRSAPRRAGCSSRTATSGGAWWPRRGPSASSSCGRSSGCWSATPSSSRPAAAASRPCTSRAAAASWPASSASSTRTWPASCWRASWAPTCS
jgi:hypothetical protein